METKIRLDPHNKVKPPSRVYGERAPDDPQYRVSWWQDGLPFDANGELVADDGKTASWQAKTVDDKTVTHFPLWTDFMRKKLKQKLARIEAAQKTPSIDEDSEEAVDMTDLPSEVNLEMWLRGEIDYQMHLLVAAAKRHHGLSAKSKQELVAFLIDDVKLIPENQVHPKFRSMLPQSFPTGLGSGVTSPRMPLG